MEAIHVDITMMCHLTEETTKDFTQGFKVILAQPRILMHGREFLIYVGPIPMTHIWMYMDTWTYMVI